MLFDPESYEVSAVYPKPGSFGFYSYIMGEQQLLENGNYLITDSVHGRVFEVTAEGEMVWEFVLPYDAHYASLFAIARRFPMDYFKVKSWDCPS